MAAINALGQLPGGAQRRFIYRRGKRRLAEMLARCRTAPRGEVNLALRRFLRARSRRFLERLLTDRAFTHAALATLLAAASAQALPPVNLSDVAAGSGGFLMHGVEFGHAGHSVSGAGDVNGDGLADVIVGAYEAGPQHNGKSYVIFGKADGNAVAFADVSAGIGGFVVTATGGFYVTGWSVSGAGDVNGDGLADVIVGAPYNTSAGTSFVVFGKADGAAVNLVSIVAGNGGFVIDGAVNGDSSGFSVAGAGDVNGDGLADVVVGDFRADPGGNINAGASYVVFGKANGSAVNLPVVAAGVGGFVMNGAGPGDHSGYSVSGTGDVNGDGLTDVVVGAYGAGGGAGKSYVVFGKADGGAVNLLDVAAGLGGFVINGFHPATQSGYSVSGAGDVNGDGLADVIVGEPGPPGPAARGLSYVVFGKANGVAVDLSDVTAGDGGYVIEGIDAGDRCGFSVSGAGDVDGDGLADVVVGAPGADPGGDSGAGESYIVLGKADGSAVDLAVVAAGVGGFVINGFDQFDGSGSSVSDAGDVNGDGLADVVVGAPNGGSFGSGEGYVVFSPVLRGDLDGDGSVGVVDFLLLLGAWGPCAAACPPFCPGDLDGDCTVGVVDFLLLLANWA